MGKSFRVRMDNAQKNAAPAPAPEADVTALLANDFPELAGVSAAPGEPPASPVAQEEERSEAGDSAPSEEPPAPDSEPQDQDAPSEPPPEAPRTPQELFGDVAVCQALRIRRRVLAAARRADGARGRDWDIIGQHAGMTRSWVTEKALELHVVPNFDLLTPIAEGDNVVSCMYVTPIADNFQRVIAEVVATGERKLAFVRDWRTMQPREIFDCRNDHGRLNGCWELNKVAY